MMTSAEIRKEFLLFFKSRGHEIVPSASIVVKNDPTLLFTNAGMNQFKDYFLGNKKAPYHRAADTQKCLRVSGKHNDLEEVGVDTYHHTMFEMLGNWSFGDPAKPEDGYFKKEAIEWSWELLTHVYQIPKDRLYVTVFEGDEKENLPKDDEAAAEWKRWISENRIISGNKKDNFWEMGDTGPCGPCTEIHVDCRPEEERLQVDGKQLVNQDHPQVIEIWNNVFIQYNRLKDGRLEQLPAKHVDTGMGLERLVRVLQQKESNYDSDIFSGTIQQTAKISAKKYEGSSCKKDIAFRVIADHIRAIAFTIADGQLPSNTGAGYVIRRILRRAVRYYYSWLDYKQPLLFQLIPGISEQFKTVFPELLDQRDFVSRVVKEEEEAFLRTLDKGLKKIEEVMNETRLSAGKVINGKAAFDLFDTFGFPADLTRLIAAENDLSVDEEGFNREMQQQKDRSRAASLTDTEDWIVLDPDKTNEFLGYDSLELESRILRYRKVKTKGREVFQIVLNKTPFYAESGGQAGDAGELIFKTESLQIIDTKKENDVIIHVAERLPAEIDPGVLAKVDPARRRSTAVHHSATHLLHAALKQVLGKHVAQKGSLVNQEHLRFDFSHFAKVTDEALKEIEATVNEKIRNNIPVITKQMAKDDAMALGATALFGEKYGEQVRVVMIDPAYSVELCGGTHAGATGELGYFKIVHETAVAAGVRRIEAVCGKAADEYLNEQLLQLNDIKHQLKNPNDLRKAIENVFSENAELKKKIEKQEEKQLTALRKELAANAERINGVNFVGGIIEVSSADALKKLAFDMRNDLKDFLVVLAADINGKASVVVTVEEGLSAARKLEAPEIIKQHIAGLIKGGGGGQKTLATAGGQDTGKLKEVITVVRSLIS